MTGACQTTTPRCHLDTWPHTRPLDKEPPVLDIVLPKPILVIMLRVPETKTLDIILLAPPNTHHAPHTRHVHANDTDAVIIVAL